MIKHFKIDGVSLKAGPYNWFIKDDEETNKEYTLTDVLKYAHKSTTYLEYAEVLKDVQFKTKPGTTFTLFIKNGCLYTFQNIYKNNELKKAKLLDEYTFESEDVQTIFKSLYSVGRVSWSKGLSITTTKKHPVLGINECIFRLIVACKLLDKQGIPVYNNFEKKFPNGKIRVLSEPHESILSILKDLNQIFYSAYGEKNKGTQCAYKKGLNIVDNARPHANNRYVFKGDISNFFPSCKRELVKKYSSFIFENSIKGGELLEYFLDKMLVDDGLCLGNPISATLANAIVAAPSKYIYNMCKKCDVAFTQYSDDVTFSSNKPIAKNWVIKLFYEAYDKYNLKSYFTLKPSKLVGQVGQQRNVTGIAFDHTRDNKPTTKGRMYRYLRVAIHKYAQGEPTSEQKLRKIRGIIAYSIMVGTGERILRYLNKFGEEVKRTFLSENLENKILTNDIGDIELTEEVME